MVDDRGELRGIPAPGGVERVVGVGIIAWAKAARAWPAAPWQAAQFRSYSRDLPEPVRAERRRRARLPP